MFGCNCSSAIRAEVRGLKEGISQGLENGALAFSVQETQDQMRQNILAPWMEQKAPLIFASL